METPPPENLLIHLVSLTIFLINILFGDLIKITCVAVTYLVCSVIIRLFLNSKIL